MSAMGSVWKRLQRVNKRAAKFQFTASYHELRVATTPKWRPSNLSVVWTRRSRRVSSTPLPWEPDMMNPLVGNVSWPVPDNHVITVTLFKDPRTHEMEDKNWTFVLEDITPLGKKRVLANASINMRQYASIQSTQQTFVLNLKPVSRKITAVDLELTISCVFLMEGKATDEDMQSVVSLMSVTNNCDVAPLEDLEYIKESENPIDLHDITNQLEQLTTNLNGGTNLPTPLSIPSLSEDMTPLAETNNLNFDKEPNGDGYAKTNSKNVSESQELARISLDDALKTPSANIIASSVTTSVTTPTTSITTTTAQQEGKHKKTECGFRMQRDGYCNIVFTSTPTNNEGSVIKNNESLSMLGMNTTDFISLIIKEEEEQSRRRKLGLESLITFDKFVFTSIRTMHTTSSTTTSVKRPALQPLNLKKSYESIDSDHIQIQGVNNVSNAITTSTSTSTSTTTTTTMPNVQSLPNGHLNMSTCKPIEKIILKENTPGQDLLEWCKEITKDYPNIMVTNLTTSWRNGMAFCAIIHHYKPHLIDMSELKPENVENNCRLAFDTAESLGIPRVIAPSDMKLLKVPDKLAVITYLYQLRSHFTGEQLKIELIGSTSDESSYVIGNYKTDNLSSQNLLNLSHLKAHLLHQNSIEDDICSITDETPQISPTAKKDVKNLPKNSKTILGKELSPTKDKNYMNTSSATPLTKTPSSPIIEDNHYANIDLNKDTKENFEKGKYVQNSIQEVQSNSVAMTSSKTALDPLKTNKILSRHKEQSDKARIMMEKLKKTQVDKNMYDEERQQRLREQARRLILETRNKLSDSSRPTSPTKITSTTSILTTAKSNTTATTNYYNNTMDHNNLLSYTITNSSITDDKCCVQSGSTITTTLIDEVPKTTTTATATKILITPTKKYNTFTCDNDNTIINNNCSDDSNKSNHPTLSSHRLSEDLLNGTTPLQSFNAVMDRISPKNEKKLDKLSYIESELEALEREQEAIDKKARNLEKKLRAVMGGNPKTEETEEQLLSQWFTLVNKKNALLRRQMQLNILEQEDDLERKYAMLIQELRAAQSVEDWRKTEPQREKEKLLLEDVIAIVNKRNELVQRLHNEEIAIEDDHEIARELEQVDIRAGKEKCIIQ